MALSNLHQRILTALVLIPLVTAGVLLLSHASFALASGAVFALAAWEWSRLAGLVALPERLLFLGLIGLGQWALWTVLPESWIEPILLALGLWWLGIGIRLAFLSRVRIQTGRSPWALASAVPVLLGAWLALVVLQDTPRVGPALVLFLLVALWVADTGAYFAGRRWGERPLAPAISPGKTWTGVLGALLGVGLLGAVVSAWLQFSLGLRFGLLGLVSVTAGFSIVGDLFESLLKRRQGLKDSGRLLPGHGGLLDRIDSLLAAAPIFTLGIRGLERFS